MKRIFFFDIDNTLLDHDTSQIPSAALEAIAALKAQGHVIVVATGRAYGHAAPYIHQVQPDFSITNNGACIRRNDAVLQQTPLNAPELQALFALMAKRGLFYGVNDGMTGHVSAQVPQVMTPMESVDIKVHHDLIELDGDVLQGWLFFDESLDAQLIPDLLNTFPSFDYVRWHQTAVDVLPKGVNKWTACMHVLELLGMHVQKSLAFGDGLNDMEMLQGAGIGVAMGNGHPDLIAVADRVAEPMGQNGLAKMLAQLQVELATQ
jgi:Cof subfamily protein (haloacid dehalogenase superfamily)